MTMFDCTVCDQTHTKQVFVSHSRADTALVHEIERYLCQAQVRPFLYEIPEHLPGDPPASWEIMKELRRSTAIIAVLGPEASRRQWTQVWIGFELGAFTAFQVERDFRTPPSHNIPHTFLIEDRSQRDDAPIPFVDLALLLDFRNAGSWEAVQSIAELVNDDVPLSATVLARANSIRLFQLIGRPGLVCPDPGCRSKYELLIWTGDCQRDDQGFPALPQTFTIKCVVCRKVMLITASEDHPGNPATWTIAAAPVAPHISESMVP